MDTRKILSGLCYFSIFFAAFLFPIVVYFVTEDFVTKAHAKKAFLSHLVPIAAVPIVALAAFLQASGDSGALAATGIIGFIIYFILVFAVVIWNIIKGIKAIQEPEAV